MEILMKEERRNQNVLSVGGQSLGSWLNVGKGKIKKKHEDWKTKGERKKKQKFVDKQRARKARRRGMADDMLQNQRNYT